MPSESNEYHIDIINDAASPVEILASKTGFSRQKIKQAMLKGAVWLTDSKGTHRLRRHSKKLSTGTTLHFYFDAVVLNGVVDDAVLIADESDYSVWYKPRGMLSQGSKWGDHGTINRWVEKNLKPQRPAFIIHRLDRFASGLILLAHKKKTATLLAELFQKKKITKQYKVIVHGLFPDKMITFENKIDNKPAVSHMTLFQYDEINDHSLLHVDIETGRKHQIRLHLFEAGFPVVGDRLYRAEKNNNENNTNLQLTAVRLSFINPVDGKEKIYRLADELQPKLKN